MSNKYEINNKLPFNIHDGCIRSLKWINDELSFSIEGCYVDGKIELVNLSFEGVTWIRSLCINELEGYIEGTQYDNYPMLDRAKLNNDFEEYVYRGILDDITVENNVVFVNQILFFDYTSFHIS